MVRQKAILFSFVLSVCLGCFWPNLVTATNSTALGTGVDYGYGLYNFLGTATLHGGSYISRANDPSSFDADGIFSIPTNHHQI